MFLIISTIFYVLLALLLLGVLVTVHEAGHFLVARLCGIQVMEFSIGMGPKLFARTGKRGTVYSLRALPVGGYCKFYGEDEDVDDPRAYNKQAVWKRFLSVLAGPVMNFVAGFVIVLVFVFAIGEYYLQVQEVTPDMPAAQAGLLAGDVLVGVDGLAVSGPQAVSNAVANSGGQPVTLTVMRADGYADVVVTPQAGEEPGTYAIGILYGSARVRLPFWESVQVSANWCVSVVQEVWRALVGLVTRGEGADEIAGPVGTIDVIQQQTRVGGLDVYLKLAALISLNLGLMNLLPIPALDGSRLIFFLIEAVRRKPVNPNVEGAIHMAGFALLMLVVVVFTYQDILRIFT